MKELIDYIKENTIDQKRYQLGSTYKTLLQVDDVINYHNKNFTDEKTLVVINIYGLLQSLFVGIDSLYTLVIGITNHKFNINVNQNRTLNGLKHIRNDIVGHPTNRRYGQSGIAYSVIKNDDLTYNEFKYITYMFNNNTMSEKEIVVNLVQLKDEYSKEKQIIVNRLKDFINKDITTINLENEILEFYHESTLSNLEKIRTKFVKFYGDIKEHRFMWRLNLIQFALNWKDEDTDVQMLIDYIVKYQTIKLIQINNEMENKVVRLPYTKIPPILRKIYKYIDNNAEVTEYIYNLHDNNNPYYESDLNYLLETVNNKSFITILNLMKNTNNNEIVYLLGSILKNYKKK